MDQVWDELAEEAVLAVMMEHRAAVAKCQDAGLLPEHFYRPMHGTICKAIFNLENRGKDANAIAVRDELRQRGLLDEQTSLAVLSAQTGGATVTGVAAHAQIVVDAAAMRKLQQAAVAIQEIAAGVGSADEKLESADKAFKMALESADTGELELVGTRSQVLMSEFAESARTGKAKRGLLTGFTELDKLTNGMMPGQLIVLAARPGMGKSTLAQNICENVAGKGTTVGLYSLEMSEDEIIRRMLASIGPTSYDKLRRGPTTPEELVPIVEAQAKLAELPIAIFDGDIVSPSKIRAQARRLQRTKGIGLIVVDYIQLMIGSTAAESRQNEVAAISRALKMMARELKVPVLALSQLNRAVEHRENKRPGLADLRDSGAIEQDADLVIFLYRDDYYNADAKAGEAELIVAKQRSGALGTVKLDFVGARSKFSNQGKFGGAGSVTAVPTTNYEEVFS